MCVCVSCQAVLAQRQEGDSRIEELRAQAQRLAQQEGLGKGQSTDVQHLVQDALAQWVTLQQDTEQLSRYSTLNSTVALGITTPHLRAFKTLLELIYDQYSSFKGF